MTPDQKLQCAMTWLSVKHRAFFGNGGHRSWSSGDYIYRLEKGGQLKRVIGTHRNSNEWIPVTQWQLRDKPLE